MRWKHYDCFPISECVDEIDESSMAGSLSGSSKGTAPLVLPAAWPFNICTYIGSFGGVV